MKLKKYLFLLLLVLVIGGLVTFAVLDIKPLSMPYQYDFNTRRLMVAEQVHEDIPAFLSIPAGLFTLYMVHLIVAYLVPQRVRRMAEILANTRRTWLQIVLLGMAAGIVLVAISLSAVVGAGTFPYAILLIFVSLISSTLGGTPILLQVGHAILRQTGWKTASPHLEIFIGTLVAFALFSIPFAGIVFLILYSSLSLGLTVVTRFGSGRPWSLNTLIQEEIE